ncbi:MAG: lysoplasmalogenase [Cyclobacteriaceae bacterium]
MKQNDSAIVKYIFMAIALLELVAHFFDFQEMRHYTKPLIIPALMVYFKRSLKAELSLSFMLAFAALIFSWIGDVSLMYEHIKSLYFLIGLSSFAIALILYVFAFKKARYNDETVISIGSQIAYILPFLVLGGFILWKLVPASGDLAYPLIVYSIIMLGLVAASILRMDQTNQLSFNQVFFGAILFLLSDSLLAFNKFLMPMEQGNLFVMLTYILAQWNIINGLLKHYNEQ